MNEWITTAFSALSLIGSGLLVYRLESRHRDQREFEAQLREDLADLRKKDDRLGMHIQQTRGAIDFVCGKLDLDRPQYPPD